MDGPVNRLTAARVEARLPANGRRHSINLTKPLIMKKVLAALIAPLFAAASFAADAPKAEAKPAAAAASAAPAAKKAEAKPAEAKPAAAPASAAAKK